MESSLEKDLEDAVRDDLLSAEEVELLKALQQEPRKKLASEFLSNFTPRANRTNEQDENPAGAQKSPSGALDALDFFKYVVQCAGKKYGESEFSEVTFVVDDYLVRRKSEEEVINWANSTISEEGREVKRIAVLGNSTFQFKRHEFTKAAADVSFGLVVGDCNELSKFFREKLVPINDLMAAGSDVLSPNRAYVEIDGNNGFDGLADFLQVDKSFAVVVAGESGSGKSVLSCLEVMNRGYLPMYLMLRLTNEGSHANRNKPEVAIDVSDTYKEKPTSKYDVLHEFLRKLLTEHEGDDKAVQVLCDIKVKANVTRNQWASDLLHQALEAFVRGNNNAVDWKYGRWDPAQRPKKVAIILDEVTDIDLAEALVEIVRETTKKLMGLVQEQVVIVVTGTGLDAMRYPGRVGTNPDYLRLVKLKGPKLNVIKENGGISKEVYNAVNEGLFSSIMKTNSRMLFRAVLPILRHAFFELDGNFEEETKRQRFEERLKKVASFGPIMDYGPRFYVNQNTVGHMTKVYRERLLADAFLYHLITAIENPTESDGRAEAVARNQEKELVAVKKIRKEIALDSEEIFSKGVAARFGTSRALKYLASFGLTCEVRVGFGDEFEELTALHYVRLMEVQNCNVKVKRVVLNHSWPPKSNKAYIQEAEILKLKEVLKDQADTELSSLTCPEPPFCFVFSQGTPTAQGGDVLVLLANSKDLYELECIQCKHYKSTKGADMYSWWSSLGIAWREGGECDVTPVNGKAGYSYTGLNAFRQLLEDRIGRPVMLGRRTMAVSFRMPPRAMFPIPKNDCTRVWFREMLEPTISTFELRPPYGQDEDSLIRKRRPGCPALTGIASKRREL